VPHELWSVKGRRIESRAESASATTPNREAGNRRSNPEEVRVDKKDSPGYPEDIHIDRKQPLGVSLKGSSLESVGLWAG
jgi:hypothetical protein